MSRTVNGDAFFGTREKEIIRKMIAQIADFSGVDVLTYCVMSNHFHVLVRVRPAEGVSDAELVRRFAVLYPKPTRYQIATIKGIESRLSAGGELANQTRAQLLARMGDVSQFMKTLKQRFSIWFNKTHERFGPLWSDRFKSVLVEGRGFALPTVAAYIDLNPVRAGLVSDPKDYRFCGYAEAVAGVATARDALQSLMHGESNIPADAALQSYRQLLFGKGSADASGKARLSHADAIRVIEKEKGVLPTAVLLRCRVRYFTDGAIIGSKAFVESHVEAWQRERRRKHRPDARLFPAEDSDLSCINGKRSQAFS